ncbi:MAG: BACON domain-containing protein [Bacteroidetes bacterium SB0662_bin_6]|nr:BACON domain-containing protein [Bacteroidetes bacterium SB0662_bin_6]
MRCQSLRRTVAILIAFLLCAVVASGCSSGGLAGQIASGELIGANQGARLQVTAATTAVGAEGGEITVDLANTGEGDMRWSASVNADWAEIEGEPSGDGNASLTLVFEANTATNERAASLTIRSGDASNSPQSIRLTQAAAEPDPETQSGPQPRLSVNADDYSVSAGGERVVVTVENEGGGDLNWSVSLPESVSWARLVGKPARNGAGTVEIEVDANPEENARSFELVVSAEGAMASPQTLHFSQEAGSAVTEDPLEISADDYSLSSEGGSVQVTVTAGADMEWEAAIEDGADWAHFSGSPHGTGNATITIVYDPNSEQALRSFVLTVSAVDADASAQTRHFTQDAAGADTENLLEISAADYELSPEGGTVDVTVTTGADVEWEAAIGDGADWAHFSGRSDGTGNGTIAIRYDRNENQALRSFELTVTADSAGASPKTLTFNQDSVSSASLSLSTATRHIGAEGEQVAAHLTLSSNEGASWAAEVDAAWTRLGSAENGDVGPAHLGPAMSGKIDGTGDAVIRIVVDPNPGPERSFTLTVRSSDAIAPQSIMFRQAGKGQPEQEIPLLPPPPAGYSNNCQRQTEGFEEFGGWLAQRGHYQADSDSRVWRHFGEAEGTNDGVVRAFSDCTSDRRTVTTNILADPTLTQPLEFGDLPAAENARVVLLDTALQSVGQHLAGARHENPEYVWPDTGSGWYPTFTQDGAGTKFLHVQPLGDWGYESASGWQSQLADWNTDGSDMSAWTDTAQQYGWRLPGIHERTSEGRRMLADADTALWLLVGGYTGSGGHRRIHPNSAVCGEAGGLCLFAPWAYSYEDGYGFTRTVEGTAVAAAQVAAALDNVLLLWPDYDLLELRDLVLDCAEDMGDAGPDSMWGRGVLSFACLFTPHGDLRDPRTGTILSGGIYGPLAGPLGHVADAPALLGAPFNGIDGTGRDFAYPLMRWSHRENHALLAATGASSGAADAPLRGLAGFAARSRSSTILEDGNFSARIAAAGDTLGAAALWRPGGVFARSGMWTFRGGLALQPEGAGPLTGSGVFRAPSMLSSAFSVAFQRSLGRNLYLNARAQHWMTLNAETRSLWEDAHLSEFRASASLSFRMGRARAVVQAQYAGGLRGRLNVAEQSIVLARQAARQLWFRVRVPLN